MKDALGELLTAIKPFEAIQPFKDLPQGKVVPIDEQKVTVPLEAVLALCAAAEAARPEIEAWRTELFSKPPRGVRASTWRLYLFLKEKHYASIQTLVQFQWGDKPIGKKNLAVAICKVRQALPENEVVLNVREQGYEWKRVLPSYAGRRPHGT